MPLLDIEVDTAEPFLDAELLYRRVSPDEPSSTGELDPSRFQIRQYGKDVKGSPSVVRSRFAHPEDVLHPDCSGGRVYDRYLVYRLQIANLPQTINSDDGRKFSSYAVHLPEPTCGAHSVIATCNAGDVDRKYAKPSRTAINDLRAKLAASFRPQPSSEVIASLAYSMWEQEGRPDGDSHGRWFRAESQLIEEWIEGVRSRP